MSSLITIRLYQNSGLVDSLVAIEAEAVKWFRRSDEWKFGSSMEYDCLNKADGLLEVANAIRLASGCAIVTLEELNRTI